MTRLPRPCLGARDPATGRHEDCGEPAVGGRCPRHLAMHEAGRPSSTRRGYDKDYRQRRKPLIGRPCAIRLPGCTGVADTADHVDPVDAGRNTRRGPLRPACGHCNSALGNKGEAWLARQRADAKGPPSPKAERPVEPDESAGWG